MCQNNNFLDHLRIIFWGIKYLHMNLRNINTAFSWQWWKYSKRILFTSAIYLFTYLYIIHVMLSPFKDLTLFLSSLLISIVNCLIIANLSWSDHVCLMGMWTRDKIFHYYYMGLMVRWWQNKGQGMFLPTCGICFLCQCQRLLSVCVFIFACLLISNTTMKGANKFNTISSLGRKWYVFCITIWI